MSEEPQRIWPDGAPAWAEPYVHDGSTITITKPLTDEEAWAALAWRAMNRWCRENPW